MAAKVSVTGGVAAALGFVPKGLGGAWGALLLAAAAATVGAFDDRGGEGLPVWGPLVAAICTAVLGVMASAALYRLALTDGQDRSRLNDLGPAGLQWGGVEWVLLGAGILVGLLQGLMLTLVGIPLVVLAYVTKTTSIEKFAADIDAVLPKLLTPEWLSALQSTPGPVLMLVAGFFLVLFAVILTARFALYAPATVAEKRMVVTSAWSLSAGSTLPLVVGLLLVLAPTFVHAWLDETYVLDLSIVTERTGVRLDPLWTAAVLEAVVGMLQVVLMAGFLAHAYRRVAPKREAPMQLGGL